MTEINRIFAQIVPVPQEVLEYLPEDMYERLNDHTVVVKEGIRIILTSRLQTNDGIAGAWSKLGAIKDGSE